MAGRLYRMAKVVSANPASWGIVDANQISGFRTVATQADLYSIAACILSSSYGDGTTTGADAVGQIWHVQDTNKDFRLTSWASRGTSAGWTEELTSAKLSEGITNVTKVANAAQETATEAGRAASAAQTTANAAKNQATANATAIAGKADKTTVDTLGQTVAGHTTSIGIINNTLKNKADSSTVSTLTGTVESIATDLTNFKALKGQPNGFAPLDANKNVPLENLRNLDTTLFEVLTGDLPNTIAKIKKHIYLKTAETTGEKNNYAEYVYTGGIDPEKDTYDATKWEKLGEVTASVDLSGYYTKSEIDKKVTAINKNSISELLVGKQDSTDAVSVVLKRAGGENELKTIIPLVNNASDNKHNGLMSPAMLTKLNGLSNYAHPTHLAKDDGLYKITVDSLGHVSAATLVTKDDIKPLAPDLTVAQSGSELAQDIKITYKGVTSTARLLSATNTEAGLLSFNNKKKLDGIAEGANKTVIDPTVTAAGANPVSGKGIYDAINTHKITNDNLSSTSAGNTYCLLGQNDSEIDEVGALIDTLTYQYDAADHSTLSIDGAAVWDEVTLRAISNDRLTEILV